MIIILLVSYQFVAQKNEQYLIIFILISTCHKLHLYSFMQAKGIRPSGICESQTPLSTQSVNHNTLIPGSKLCDLEVTIADISEKIEPNGHSPQNIQHPNPENMLHQPNQLRQQNTIAQHQLLEKKTDKVLPLELHNDQDVNKYNEPVEIVENNAQQQNKVSYYIGDEQDEDQISDSEEKVQSSSSSEEDREDGEEEEEDDQQEDEIEEEEQQQMLQLDEGQFQEQDSDDQEESQDEYPQDYDDEQEQTKFDKLFYATNAQFKDQISEQQFLTRYKSLKQALQQEQMKIKQQQMVFGLVPLPLELQIKKMRINQGYLNLINKSYLLHLQIEGGKRNKTAEYSANDNNTESKQAKQNEYQSYSDNQTQICKPKKTKKVCFLADIHMKMFKDTQQVTVINQTEQYSQMLNTTDKAPALKRVITSLAPNIPASPKIIATGVRTPPPPPMPLPSPMPSPSPSCQQIIAKCETQIHQKAMRQMQFSQQESQNQISKINERNDQLIIKEIQQQQIKNRQQQLTEQYVQQPQTTENTDFAVKLANLEQRQNKNDHYDGQQANSICIVKSDPSESEESVNLVK